MSMPLVTIGTLCYNTGKYVIEALESVKAQNYTNIQHIIIDDHSQDNSVELINKWIEVNDYDCVFIKHTSNKGIHYSLDEILRTAKGDYFGMISDDLWTNDKLNDQVSILLKHKGEVGMVYGDVEIIDEEGCTIHPSFFKTIRGENFIPPSGRIFKDVLSGFYFYIQSSLIDLKLFRNIMSSHDANIISEDWDWQLNLSRHYQIYGTDKVYAKYRRRSASVTAENWTDEKMKNVLKSHFLMIEKYYGHALNDEIDNKAILTKLKSIYWQLYSHGSFSRRERVFFFLRIFQKSKSLREFVTLTNIVVKNIIRLKIKKR